MKTTGSYTGYTRQRINRWSVRFSEIASRYLITLGGIGTIIAVATVCVFLVWVAYPAFLPSKVKEVEKGPPPETLEVPLRSGIDEYQLLAWGLYPNGELRVYRVNSGKILEKRQLLTAGKVTACSSASREEELAVGFENGTVQTLRIGFTNRPLDTNEEPEQHRGLKVGEAVEFEKSVLTRMSDGQMRAEEILVEIDDPIKPTSKDAIHLIDQSKLPSGPILALLSADGTLRTSSIVSKKNLLTGKITRKLSGGDMQLPPRTGFGLPKYLMLTGVGDNVLLIWEDGHFVRVDARNIEAPKVAEEAELLGAGDLTVTASQFMIGKTTLLVGDSSGRVRAWFGIKPAEAPTPDGIVYAVGHEFPASGSALTVLTTSTRNRTMAAGYADGRVRLYYVTSEKFLAEVQTAPAPVREVILAPRDDLLVAWSDVGTWHYSIDLGHPEITPSSILRPVRYEGYEKPEHVWQATGGDDAVETKFGLWPLVFGTIKATSYALLIGVPLALLAAIFTNAFLHPRTRALVKPTVELMASLPSVVLGFLCALLLAPFVERLLPAVLSLFLTMPTAFVLGAYGWQLLPDRWTLRLERWRFLFICLLIPAGLGGAKLLGPLLERVLFGGDLKGWLNGHGPGAANGLFLILLPLAALATIVLLSRVVNPWYRRVASDLSRLQHALLDVAKFVAAAVFTGLLAYVVASIICWFGYDPRGDLVGTYIQRNALVVGFILGFAIIPIIYTIAEDALAAVPEHLRAASLACGATPWQTVTRITVPTAMSGMFSAVMIGLGRAVGETMIVLLGGGNTPILDWNMFNGFRTLSANIAVELPEAARNTTHYRTLFIAALILFAMTFALNTVAEIVRQRFRKRAFQL
jgi:phosphate transport system permease protein